MCIKSNKSVLKVTSEKVFHISGIRAKSPIQARLCQAKAKRGGYSCSTTVNKLWTAPLKSSKLCKSVLMRAYVGQAKSVGFSCSGSKIFNILAFCLFFIISIKITSCIWFFRTMNLIILWSYKSKFRQIARRAALTGNFNKLRNLWLPLHGDNALKRTNIRTWIENLKWI